MTAHIKVGGAWNPVTHAYVKQNDAWQAGSELLVKNNGTWRQGWIADRTPPQAPVLQVTNFENKYARIGVRMPQTTHQTNIRRIRVLVSRPKEPNYPTSQFSSAHLQITNGPNVVGGVERWHDWWYNNQGTSFIDGRPFVDGRDTTQFSYKNFSSELPWTGRGNLNNWRGGYLWVIAWAESMSGVWSAPAFIGYWIPSTGGKGLGQSVHMLRLRPSWVGSYVPSNGLWTPDYARVGGNPSAMALFHFGDAIEKVIPAASFRIKIHLYVKRKAMDHGQQQARQWVGRLTSKQVGDTSLATSDFAEWGFAHEYDATPESRISLGQGKRITMPAVWSNSATKMRTQMKGIGFSVAPSDTLGTQQEFEIPYTLNSNTGAIDDYATSLLITYFLNN